MITLCNNTRGGLTPWSTRDRSGSEAAARAQPVSLYARVIVSVTELPAASVALVRRAT